MKGTALRKKGVARAKVEEMVRLKKAGMSTKQIVKATGCAASTVRNYLAAEGLWEGRAKVSDRLLPPEGLTMAEPVEFEAERVCFSGHRFFDVTPRYIPH